MGFDEDECPSYISRKLVLFAIMVGLILLVIKLGLVFVRV